MPFRDLLLDADGGVQPAILLFVGDEQVIPANQAATRRRSADGAYSDGRRLINRRLRRLFHLNVNGREVFVVAVGIERLDAQHIEARRLDRKGHARPDPAFRL